MMDEAEARGVAINIESLAGHLKLPVVPTVATRNRGVSELKAAILSAKRPEFRLTYSPPPFRLGRLHCCG
jgi:ferrous iron transport protein B